MMAALRTIRIGDLGRVVTGKTPPSARPELFGEDFPFLTPTDIDGQRRYIEPERFISAEGRNYQSRLLLPEKTVCVVCIGATIGKVCMTSRPSFTNQQINSVVVNEAEHDPFFVYHLLTTLRNELKANAGGSATPIINKTAFSEIEVNVPPLPTQRRIASILSTYDELIENNQRRIRILEEMARSLYREWFVHFRYPGHESVPLVDSSLGPIPQGWEVKKVGDLLAKIPRQPKIKTQDYLPIGALPVIDQGREFVGGFTDDIDAEYSGQLPVIVFGDHTRIIKFVDFPFACGADGTQLMRSNDKRMPISLFYYSLFAVELSNFAYARHFKFLKEELLIVPESGVATAFAGRIDPIKKHVRTLQQQLDNLRRTRDLLLPRLLSGQVVLNSNILEELI